MEPVVAAPNFRDLCGPTADGRSVRPGALFRSEAIVAPGDADARALTALDIRFVCDLRSAAERFETPNGWWAAQGVALAECDILANIPDALAPWAALERDPGHAGAVTVMERLYAAFPEAAAPYLPAIVAGIAGADGASLIHCTAGKDRTGFVCAVLLGAIGVSRDAIVRDYLDSHGRRTDRARAATRTMIRHRIARIDEDGLDALMGVDAAYLAAALAVIDERFGGVARYLAAAGVDAAALARLRERLLA